MIEKFFHKRDLENIRYYLKQYHEDIDDGELFIRYPNRCATFAMIYDYKTLDPCNGCRCCMLSGEDLPDAIIRYAI